MKRAIAVPCNRRAHLGNLASYGNSHIGFVDFMYVSLLFGLCRNMKIATVCVNAVLISGYIAHDRSRFRLFHLFVVGLFSAFKVSVHGVCFNK